MPEPYPCCLNTTTKTFENVINSFQQCVQERQEIKLMLTAIRLLRLIEKDRKELFSDQNMQIPSDIMDSVLDLEKLLKKVRVMMLKYDAENDTVELGCLLYRTLVRILYLLNGDGVSGSTIVCNGLYYYMTKQSRPHFPLYERLGIRTVQFLKWF
jgi:hypothetical protein